MSGRVAITGFGAVTPVGNDRESTWDAFKAGKSGIGPITTFDASTFPVQIAGLVKDYDVAERVENPELTQNLSRAGSFAVGAALEAVEDAGLESNGYAPEERGISLGGSVGRTGLQEMSDILASKRAIDEGTGELVRWTREQFMSFDQNLAPAVIGHLVDCQGPMISVSTACTGAAHAIGEGMRRIQDGEAKVMLSGGYDSLTSWLDVLGFSLLGALTTEYNDDPERASRPFDNDRSGFVLGEGSVVAVLEDWDSAKERGARIYAELGGYGSSLNAYRMTDPPPDGGGAVLAMRKAMKEADLGTADVDYVVAHATSTPAGDVSETIAIKRVFEDDMDKVVVTSPKSMVGHSTCAAAGINLLAAVLAIRDSVVSPTINVDNQDPELDIDVVPNEAREMPVRAAVINSFAFGGTNGAMAVKKAEE
jgi:3-oxoacyl-[acyl-carrier-protein] synthase II